MTRPLASSCTLALLLLLPFAACSDDDDGGGEDEVGDGDGDPGDGDGDPGDGDGDPGDGDGDPGDGDGDPGDGDGDPGDGDGDPGDGDGDPGDGDGDPGDGDGDPGDESVYTTEIMPGGLDRIRITRVNNNDPSCTIMTLYKPGFDSFDITMPDGWAIEDVKVWQQGFCPMDEVNPHGLPETGSGSLSFPSYDALMVYPCTIDFDFEMDMNTDPPLTTYWTAEGVPVDGVNCG